MRRLVVFLACLFASAHAAMAISILDAFSAPAPGITFHIVREAPDTPALCATPPSPPECPTYGSAQWNWTTGTDAAGSFYSVAKPDRILTPDVKGYLLRRTTTSGADEAVAILATQTCDAQQILGDCPFTRNQYSYGQLLTLDVVEGRIVIAVQAVETVSSVETDRKRGIVEIRGLPKLLDVTLTYVPPDQLVALTPRHPDGFASADTMQVWAGDVRTMPDWSQAQPLACEAASSPSPGQRVTVTDTLPNPPVGSGRYYLVATANAGDRRLGRQYIGSGFSARDPAALPICNP